MIRGGEFPPPKKITARTLAQLFPLKSSGSVALFVADPRKGGQQDGQQSNVLKGLRMAHRGTNWQGRAILEER